MIVLRRIPPRPHPFKNPVVAIGIFDGVHRGHRAILHRAVQRAAALVGTPMAATFAPHPAAILAPASVPPLLLSLEQRLEAFARAGIRVTLVIPFTRGFSRWSPEVFVQRVLVRGLAAREVVVGHDFGFGAGRSGSVSTLRALGDRTGFKVRVVPPVKERRQRIASGLIRQLVREGKLETAAHFLGRPVSVVGRVIRGVGRGRRLGFRTANLRVEAGVLPPVGVYAVRAHVARRSYAGMANFGFRPTFGKKSEAPLLEIHLFGRRDSLYGQRVEVAFLKFLRPERTFSSSETLARQLARDAHRAKGLFALQHSSSMIK